ncbi:Resolvase domain protein [Candidatus Glomeribacter gigasporarum BEG34]|uniref:Resolvase domain protein n=1 Tax=Candidatus Glomeribacter gigasporarum BEG34 TaxID=1070319 RepID=G2J9C5_9BURK|nr:recombinase family protein [Candidatus Glomeribacter gigasporarum]CCD29372.1 Resolvase domain protein [Candidatus Glomeribacter gigasporarum BEG34]
MITKITEQHYSKPAYIYIRQSTPAQVRHHQESTERQYALRDKALALGWPETAIRTLDRDLGQSGARMKGREDFKTLVADVSMGQVGAVFALEVSRLARSNLDWHRLLELCALTHTLVIDADGCYDPGDFNDGLLLGLKGTMAQAKLHFLRGRLQGGKLNKAQKGELRFPLPVGLCYDDEGRIVLDPNDEVRGAVQWVFRLFQKTGSAYAVVKRFTQSGLRFPKRAYGGAWAGQLIWGRLSHGRVLGLIKNPSYAGVYVFGRYQYRKHITRQGDVRQRVQRVPRAGWRVHLPEHHKGYITLDEFEQNQAHMAHNRTNSEETLLSGPAREGLALLQGLLVCGRCGRAITIRYQGHGGIYPVYLCSWQRRESLATKDCMSVRSSLLDDAISEAVLKRLQPAELELAVTALKELEQRDQTIMRQWQMRIERAQYEAALAEQRYQECDPANRLVAGTLERRWNDALLRLESSKTEAAQFQSQKARIVTPEQEAQILALARDLPRLWHAPTTQAKDRKRMLRLLIRGITVKKLSGQRQIILHIRWQGGTCNDITVNLPKPIADAMRYPVTIVEQVRELSQHLSDSQIVARFNQVGLRSPRGKPCCILDWPHKADHFMRWQRGIACKQVNEVLGERQDALCFLCWSSSGQMGEAQASHPIGKYGESQLFKHTARGGCNPMAAYIGVDVSKHVLDAQMGAHYFQVENTAKGLKKFIRALEKCIQSGNPVSTVVCEASGGYERD